MNNYINFFENSESESVFFVVDISNNNIITSASDSFFSLTDYSYNDIIRHDLFLNDFLTEKYRFDILNRIHEIVHTKNISFLKFDIQCKNTDVLNLICMCDPCFEKNNDNKYVKVTICKITSDIILDDKICFYSNEDLKYFMNNIPGGAVLCEIVKNKFMIVEANEDYYKILGYDKNSNENNNYVEIFNEEDFYRFHLNASKHIYDNSSFIFEIKTKRIFDSSINWFGLNSRFFGFSENGNALFYFIIMNITDKKKAQNEISKQNKRFHMIAENTNDIYFEYDVAEDIMHIANCSLKYKNENNLIYNYYKNKEFKKFIHPDDYQNFHDKFTEFLITEKNGTLEFRTCAFDDKYTWYKILCVSVADERGKITNIYGRLFSIEHVHYLKNTIEIDKAMIQKLSTTDSLTGLLIRNAFKEKVLNIITNEFDENYCYGLVYSDINDFSYVNDNFGFEAGNQMLYDFACDIISSPEFIAGCRIYSDFFVVFIKSENRNKLLDSVRRTNNYFTEHQKKRYPASELHISSGVYIIPDKNIDITIAIDNANLARKSVKGIKEIPFGIYSERLRKQRSHDQAIAAELQSALLSGQIELFLQPKFSIDKRELIGAEALSRWKNSDGSYKLPFEFISVLEKVGYIVDLDMYIYDKVLKTMANWKHKGKKLFPISINFSRHHSNRKDFVESLIFIAEKYGIDKKFIELEITENSFMQNINVLFNSLNRLRKCGFKVDIDDFGMGYSSLSVLLNAPVDIVKIDKIFIDNIANDSQAREYVSQICELIKTTNKDIIFEGVETESQAKILYDMGQNKAQGWLFDKAIPVDEFEEKYLCLY